MRWSGALGTGRHCRLCKLVLVRGSLLIERPCGTLEKESEQVDRRRLNCRTALVALLVVRKSISQVRTEPETYGLLGSENFLEAHGRHSIGCNRKVLVLGCLDTRT